MLQGRIDLLTRFIWRHSSLVCPVLKQFAPDGAAAKTKAKTRALIAEAIAFHIEGVKKFGEPAPRPSCEAVSVKINAPRAKQSARAG